MRIFYAASDTPNYWYLPQSRIWHNNLYLPLRDLGHELISFEGDWGRFHDYLDPQTPEQREFVRMNRPILSEQLVRQVRAAHAKQSIDLFFSYFYSAQVDPEAIRQISAMGIPTVNWYCNGSFQFDLVEEIAPAFDYCLVPEKFRLADYRRIGANPIYCQEAANPNIYQPHDTAKGFDVTFVGQRYGNRAQYIKRLIEAKVDVRVWGPRWDEPPGQKFVPGGAPMANVKSATLTGLDAQLAARAGGSLPDDELVRMYSRSRISLGFSAVARIPKDGSPPIKQVRLRDFEAPMSGAFYLTEQIDELEEFFEPDREIVFFRDEQELADKASFYLAHESQRERIRIAGMNRARREHTWHARFEQVFRHMGLPRLGRHSTRGMGAPPMQNMGEAPMPRKGSPMRENTVLGKQSNSASASLVVTTIGKGDFLSDYHDAIVREQCADRVRIIVIPDRKSPPQLYQRCEEFRARGLSIECPGLEEQERYLSSRDLAGFVPFNSDNRRNIGYLMALENGSDYCISIDDDNFCRPGEDFFSEHAIVCAPHTTAPCVNATDGFFNICDLMQMEPSRTYPRGFPYKHRHQQVNVTRSIETAPVRVNAGLWLNEPDIDAMSWLVAPVRATEFRGESVLLGDRAWSPINTQNTSLHRDVIASYYFLRMGYPLAGMSIDRYGDILSGYFSQACVRHMGHRIRVGTPLVDHRRNSHHYLRDATHEMGCVWLIEDLADWLVELKLQGSTYVEAYQSLASELDDAAERFTGFIWTDATRGYLHQAAWCMRRWARACEAIAGTGAASETGSQKLAA